MRQNTGMALLQNGLLAFNNTFKNTINLKRSSLVPSADA